jgi:anti-sigma B factor antagonist
MSDVPAKPTISIEKSGQAVIVRPQSRMMDENEIKSLAQVIDQAAVADAGVSLVVLDLSLVQMLPSLGLGALVQISNKCRARQQKFKLAAVQPSVRQVFSITKLDRVFDMAASVESAMS